VYEWFVCIVVLEVAWNQNVVCIVSVDNIIIIIIIVYYVKLCIFLFTVLSLYSMTDSTLIIISNIVHRFEG